MIETKCCGNCKHFANKDVDGCGFCTVVDDIVVYRESCEEHIYVHNGWTEITPDNVEEVSKEDACRLIIAVLDENKEPRYMEYCEWFSDFAEMAEEGGYYYYVLPELKIE